MYIKTDVDHGIAEKKATFLSWLAHLRNVEKGVYTRRTICREMEAKGQTCVYEGIICTNTTSAENKGRPKIWFIDDNQEDMREVPTDNWCGYRWKAADPRYYSTRHWPIMENTVVPQQSCMEAWYRKSAVLFGNDPSAISKRIKWVPSIALLDFDFLENDHNGHFASDSLWLLDAILFQESLDVQSRPGYQQMRRTNDNDTMFIFNNTKLYFPHSTEQFKHMTGRDVNRLLFSEITRQDLRKLYKSFTDEELSVPPTIKRETEKLFDAYPDLANSLEFHGDHTDNPDIDMVCTPRLTGGFKTGFSVHERVCRDLRTRAFDLYKIPRPQVRDVGNIQFPQPPKSILVLNRHVTRRIGNVDEVVKDLTELVAPLNVSVTHKDTSAMETAEEWVRLYSKYGIIITPHGSQNMGQMWMQRYAALIEIMPVGYTEHSFSMWSEPCKIWFYEFHSSSVGHKRSMYEEKCGMNTPHMFKPCVELKSEDVLVNTTRLRPVVLLALERLGYDTGHIWFDDVYPGTGSGKLKDIQGNEKTSR